MKPERRFIVLAVTDALETMQNDARLDICSRWAINNKTGIWVASV